MTRDKYAQITDDATAPLIVNGDWGIISFVYCSGKNEIWGWSRIPIDTAVANGASVLDWPLLDIWQDFEGYLN